ncbi:hypothetical protein [Legionella cardiaca]|uniref:Bacteriocin n=1 Tax=Legionella cardiaca TaxID=1071983 RepID=A0ABY8ASP2_9GAMM|nr:hypothetical protein [Legionella cardiaca]WED42187.1 hypothetical protein PXX05_09620 [Legionella cardiaca]
MKKSQKSSKKQNKEKIQEENLKNISGGSGSTQGRFGNPFPGLSGNPTRRR